MGHTAVRRLFLLLLLLAAVLARAAEPVTLRFVVWDGDEALKTIKEQARAFEAAHPGIQVAVENVSYDLYFDKLLTEYAAGVAPDVAMLNPDFFQRYSSRGALMPLNDLAAKTPGFSFDDWYPSILKACSYKGTVYVLPRDIAPIAIVYYNKQALDKAGIPYPDGTWTWDFKPHPEDPKDFTTILQKLQKKDASGKVTGWGLVPDDPTFLIDAFTLGQGARYVDDPENPTKLLYDDPRVVDAFQLYSDLANKDRLVPSTISLAGTSSRQLFTQQKCAMLLSGIWVTNDLRKEISKPGDGGFDWDIGLGPSYRNGKQAYPTGGSGYAIMAKTAHPKEAWELTRWMAGEHGMEAMAAAGIAQPAIRKYALQEPWIPGPTTPPAQQVPHNRIITDQAEPHVVFAPTGFLYKEVNDIVRQPATQIYSGDKTAKEAFAQSLPLAQQRLDTLRRELDLKPFNWGLASLFGVLVALAIVAWVYGPEIGKRRTNREKREARAAYAFLAPWLVGIVAFTAGPMILSLIMSFADWDIITPARWRGLGNYNEALRVDPVFWKSTEVTFLYTAVSVPLGIVFSLALALLLNTKVKGIAIWRTCYYIPAMASPIASSLIWVKLFQPEGGLMNGLVTPHPRPAQPFHRPRRVERRHQLARQRQDRPRLARLHGLLRGRRRDAHPPRQPPRRADVLLRGGHPRRGQPVAAVQGGDHPADLARPVLHHHHRLHRRVPGLHAGVPDDAGRPRQLDHVLHAERLQQCVPRAPHGLLVGAGVDPLPRHPRVHGRSDARQQVRPLRRGDPLMATLAGRDVAERRARSSARKAAVGGRLARIGALALLFLGSAAFLVPFYVMLAIALKSEKEAGMTDPWAWPRHMTLENFRYVIENPNVSFSLFLRNTAFISITNTVGTLFACSVAAYAFARLRFPGRDRLFLLLLSTMMLPGIVTMIPNYVVMAKLGWVNSFKPLTIPSFFGAGAAFNIFLLRQFFMGIPNELDEAAILDGAGQWTIFSRIVMPLSGAALATVGVLAFIYNWKDFMGPLLYLNSPNLQTNELGLSTYNALNASKWHLVMAGSVLVMIPIIVIFFVGQRYFVKGLAMTGGK